MEAIDIWGCIFVYHVVGTVEVRYEIGGTVVAEKVIEVFKAACGEVLQCSRPISQEWYRSVL